VRGRRGVDGKVLEAGGEVVELNSSWSGRRAGGAGGRGRAGGRAGEAGCGAVAFNAVY
jgi:hypothetical protein